MSGIEECSHASCGRKADQPERSARVQAVRECADYEVAGRAESEREADYFRGRGRRPADADQLADKMRA